MTKIYRTLVPISEGEVAYLAGIFDGEGCILITRYNSGAQSGTLNVRVGMKDKIIPARFQAIFGGTLREAHKERCFPLWTWQCAAQMAAYVLDILRPYLIVKAAQADLGLEYQRQMRPSRTGQKRSLSPELLAIREDMTQQMQRLKRIPVNG